MKNFALIIGLFLSLTASAQSTLKFNVQMTESATRNRQNGNLEYDSKFVKMEISIDDKFVKVCSATDTIAYKIICSWSDPKFLAIDPTTNALVEVTIINGEGDSERTVEIGNLDKSTSYRATQIK
jgi:hypothetical protein